MCRTVPGTDYREESPSAHKERLQLRSSGTGKENFESVKVLPIWCVGFFLLCAAAVTLFGFLRDWILPKAIAVATPKEVAAAARSGTMGEHSLQQGQTSSDQGQQQGTDSAAAAGTSTSNRQQQLLLEGELRDIRQLLWGPSIRPEVFRRWSQGFDFSQHEPSALVQHDGGPCCVIAPVQAYLLKILLMETPGHSFSDVSRYGFWGEGV